MKKEFRMLTPIELWKAMGFSQNYTIDQSGRKKELRRNICLTEMELKEKVAV